MSEPNPSAALLEALDGLSGQAFALFTPDRRLCQASQSFQEKLAGLSRTSQAGADLGDVLGAFASDIGLGDDALATLTADITRRLSGPDATPIDLEQGDDAFRLQVSRCADGSFLLLISDLSELRRNERQYRSIIDQQTEYVSRHDCGFNLTFANRVYLEAFSPDGTIEPLRGKSILVYQEDSARQEAFARNLRSLTPESSVTHDLLRERVADGGLRWQLWINRALFDEEQQLLGYQAVGRDVTEEVESKNALTAIIDGALDGIVEFDQRWRVINANPAAQRLFIWSDRDVERSIDPKIAVDEGRGKTTEPLSIYLLRHIKEILGRRIELVAIRTDGKVVPLELALVDAGSEDAHRYVAFLRDLSESRRVQAELEQQRATVAQSEKLSALGSLLANVAHELNNPLSVIITQAELLDSNRADGKSLRRTQRIRTAAERCGRVVRTFLAMARQAPLSREFFAAHTAADSAAGLVEHALSTSGIEMSLEIPRALPPLHGDATQIGQVLSNLLVNAQQVLMEQPRPRRIHFSVGARDAQVVFNVSDNGPGIPDEIRHRIFDPFFTTKEEGAGTGIGLSIARSITEAHGGALTVRASELGGACFSLALPVADHSAAPDQSSQAGESAEPKAARGTLLIVDDEEDVAESIAEVLEEAGFRCDIAIGGRAALRSLEDHSFDAVMSDIRMPDIDGPALFGEVCERVPGLREHFGVFTGDSLSTTARRFLVTSRVPKIDKPFNQQSLVDFAQELVSGARTKRRALDFPLRVETDS